ncbi:uncharacterized protein LOC124230236 isoform X2 [Equus quagga]|uniref:uncharacterized protein LOC124230236 isoform X2 n=1 Tax=Equus quagga TaxID=89248 RepID=UPI001EE29FFA|nr:uncharacterized protein LOC124230236 isoform X2 [Equus quagga]
MCQEVFQILYMDLRGFYQSIPVLELLPWKPDDSSRQSGTTAWPPRNAQQGLAGGRFSIVHRHIFGNCHPRTTAVSVQESLHSETIAKPRGTQPVALDRRSGTEAYSMEEREDSRTRQTWAQILPPLLLSGKGKSGCRDRHTQGEDHVKTQGERLVKMAGCSEASASQGMLGLPEARRETQNGSFLAVSEGARLCQHVHFGLLVSKTETIDFCHSKPLSF